MASAKNLLSRCVAWSLVLAFAVPAPPQEPAGQGQVIRKQVDLVNLFATVRDNHKKIVGNLKQEDFKILEDNQAQKIAFFSREVTLPITLALLLDTSGSEQYMLSAIQDAGGRFLDRVLRTRQITGTALYDAIYLACNEKLNTEAGRKAIVIVTDAQDEGSKVRLEEAVEAAQRTDTVIHILLVADPRFGGNSGVAHKITEETGGRMISVSSEKKLLEAFDEISEELRSQYTLGYYPSNNAKDGKFRKIKVEAANRDLKVLTRKGYYAPKG